jgi:hypothetical protein
VWQQTAGPCSVMLSWQAQLHDAHLQGCPWVVDELGPAVSYLGSWLLQGLCSDHAKSPALLAAAAAVYTTTS